MVFQLKFADASPGFLIIGIGIGIFFGLEDCRELLRLVGVADTARTIKPL